MLSKWYLENPQIPYRWQPPRPIYIHAIVICGGHERGFTVKMGIIFRKWKTIFEDKLLMFQDKEFWCVSRNTVTSEAGGQHSDSLLWTKGRRTAEQHNSPFYNTDLLYHTAPVTASKLRNTVSEIQCILSKNLSFTNSQSNQTWIKNKVCSQLSYQHCHQTCLELHRFHSTVNY
jgi:hypothetical protein